MRISQYMHRLVISEFRCCRYSSPVVVATNWLLNMHDWRLMQIMSICINLQLLEDTERCVTVAEADAPLALANRYREEGDTQEVRQLARDVIRWECRPYPSMQPPPDAYVLKILSMASVSLQLFV